MARSTKGTDQQPTINNGNLEVLSEDSSIDEDDLRTLRSNSRGDFQDMDEFLMDESHPESTTRRH